MPGRVLVVTGMSARGYAEHGHRMLSTAAALWGEDVDLRVYSEDLTAPPENPRAAIVDLHEAAPWLAGFLARCDEVPRFRGVVGVDGYDFRHDARKFAHKVAALTAAGLEVGGARRSADLPDVLVWMDADTLTHAPLDAAWLRDLLPGGNLLGWLERDNLYPECGFLVFDPRHRHFAGLMLELRDMYARHRVFGLQEWHDSYVLEAIVKMQRAMFAPEVHVHSLSGAARRTSHPFINSVLSTRLDHAKGPRKDAGRTPARERTLLRDGNPYWTR